MLGWWSVDGCVGSCGREERGDKRGVWDGMRGGMFQISAREEKL